MLYKAKVLAGAKLLVSTNFCLTSGEASAFKTEGTAGAAAVPSSTSFLAKEATKQETKSDSSAESSASYSSENDGSFASSSSCCDDDTEVEVSASASAGAPVGKGKKLPAMGDDAAKLMEKVAKMNHLQAKNLQAMHKKIVMSAKILRSEAVVLQQTAEQYHNYAALLDLMAKQTAVAMKMQAETAEQVMKNADMRGNYDQVNERVKVGILSQGGVNTIPAGDGDDEAVAAANANAHAAASGRGGGRMNANAQAAARAGGASAFLQKTTITAEGEAEISIADRITGELLTPEQLEAAAEAEASAFIQKQQEEFARTHEATQARVMQAASGIVDALQKPF
ncbi:unnamed protein product [Amoebophrya sp. A120]|nr:unnamed protein product [Amoebophrya sp. A120]|eukprot:GSA120T00014244001.1